MPSDAIAVYTFKGRESILAHGGTSSWVLNRANARAFHWVVCTRNANDKSAEGPEPHGSAFLVARIAEIVPSPEPGFEDRWLIRFSEYADVAVLDAWKGWRNPVKYTTLEELGIDPSTLDLKSMPAGALTFSPADLALQEKSPFKLTIAKAKEGLANNFGVSPEAVHITIRG